MTVLELKEKRMMAEKKMETILNKAQNEKRSLAEEEEKEFQKQKEEVRSLTDKIDALTQWLAEQKVPEKRTQGRKFSYVKAVKALAEKRSLEDPEAAVNEIAEKNAFQPESRAANSILIPMEKRAALQASLAEAGKEDVATDLLDLVTPLENTLIATQAGCTFLTGLTGNIDIPFYTGTTTAWGGEIEEAKDGAGKFKKKSLAPLRISGYVDLSRQLLTQANDSVDAFIRMSLVNSVSETLEATMFGNGAAGDNNPAGLLNGVTEETGDLTYGGIVDMETSLQKNNFTNISFVGAYDALGKLKQTEKVKNYPVYLYENGLIDGRRTFASNNVASMGLIAGDFSELIIGQWGGIELLLDPYTQATKSTVRLVVNAYFNYFVRRGYDKSGKDVMPFVKKVLKA
ncbi:MAG: phage major capsid protein [Prevotella sp.]